MSGRTKTEAALEAAEKAHADDPERAELLARARRFKSSWLELGEALARVRRDGEWKRWGYTSFDDYTKRELHLRPETVDKLCGSFTFLKSRAPEVLQRSGVDTPIPSYQSIDFLRRAEELPDAPAETVAELRRRVIDEAAPLPTISRKFKEVLFPVAEEERAARETEALRAVVKRAREGLAATGVVPKRVADEAVAALDRVLAALTSDAEAEAA